MSNGNQHAHERMRENEEKAGRFNKAAVVLMATVIRPRMELVVRKFKNASLVVADATAAYRCACSYDHTTQFPASTRLEFAVGPDDRLEILVISYHLEILPVFISFKAMDHFAFPLNAVDEKLAAAWIDDRLADFTAAYLQLETAKAYQQAQHGNGSGVWHAREQKLGCRADGVRRTNILLLHRGLPYTVRSRT